MSNRNILILVILLVAIVAAVAFLSGSGENYNWMRTYKPDSKHPYGMELRKQLWEAEKSHQVHIIENDFEDKLDTALRGTNYVLFSQGFQFDSAKTEQMRQYVAHGNVAFIARNTFPEEFLINHPADSCLEPDLQWSSSKYSELRISHKEGRKYIFPGYIKEGISEQSWSVFSPLVFCKARPDLSEIAVTTDGSPFIIRMSYGKGAFYFCADPVVFSNVYTINDTLREFQDEAFSWLLPGDIYWDTAQESTYNPPPQQRDQYSRGPLYYILSQPALRWAWYLLLVMVVLFLLFSVKRKQRIIPVIAPKPNTTVEYVETIQRLFFLSGDHRKVADYNIRYFLFRIKERFHLNLNSHPEEAQLKQLSQRSGYPVEKLELIFNKIRSIEKFPETAASDLMELYNYLEMFYQFTQIDGKPRNK